MLPFFRRMAKGYPCVRHEERDHDGTGYCDACSVKVYCSLCGADITYRGGISIGDGTVVYCEDCWETVYWEQPNVTCPHCGYAFFTSGVGVDGLDCPQCGKSFMP